jgi:hypothetical protein
MRYRSRWNKYGLYQENGKLKLDPVSSKPYLWYNGVLNVGLTTTNSGSGNAIVPDLSATDGTSAMETVPSGSTDLAKVGLGTIFIEAPPIAVPNTPTANVAYEVISGAITYGGVRYNLGDIFYGVTGDTALATGYGSAQVALAIDLKYQNPTCCDEEEALFNQQHLLNGEEAQFMYGAPSGYEVKHFYGMTLQTLDA